MDGGGAFRLGGRRHRFQGGDADQGFFERDPQPPHEGQADALAGEGAGAGGDGQPVELGKTEAGFCIVSSTMGASASAWPRGMSTQ